MSRSSQAADVDPVTSPPLLKPDELLERAMTSAAPIGMFTETVSPEKATLPVALMPTPSTTAMTKKHRPRTQRQPGAVASASKVPANGKTRRAGGEKTTKKKGGKQLARAAKAQAAERQAPNAGRQSPMLSPDRAPMSASRAMASPVAARGRAPQREMSRARVIATASSDDEHSSDGEDDEEPSRVYLTLAASPPPSRLASPPLGHEASLLVAHMWALSAMQPLAWEGGDGGQWASSVPRRPPRRAGSASRSSVDGTVNERSRSPGPASPTAPPVAVLDMTLDMTLDLSVASGWRMRDLSAEANTPSSVVSAATSSWTKASSCDETLLSRSQRLAYEEAELHYATFLSPRNVTTPRNVREPLGTALGEPPLMPTMPGTALHMPGSSLAATVTAAAAVRAAASAAVSAAVRAVVCVPSAPSAAAAPPAAPPSVSPPLRSLLKREGSRSPNLSAVMSAQGSAEARLEIGSVGASERSSAKSRVSFSEHLTDRSSPRPPPVRLAHYTHPPLAPPAAPPAPRLPLPEGPSFSAQHLLVQRAMLALQGAPISYLRNGCNGWSLPADGRLQRGGVHSGVASSIASSACSFASQLSHAASMNSSQSSLHPSEWTTTWTTTPMRPGAPPPPPPPPVVAHESTLHGLNGATTTIPLRALPGNLLPGALASSLGVTVNVGGLGTRPKAPQIVNGPLPIRGPPVVGLGVAATGMMRPSEIPRHGAGAPAHATPPMAGVTGEAFGRGRPPQVPQRHAPPF